MSTQEDVLTMSRDWIASAQVEGIRKTAIHCYEDIPFYHRSFDEAGFDPYAIRDLDDLRRAPFVTKQDLRDNYRYGMVGVPRGDVKEIHMSSGTTGVATVAAYTEADLRAWAECFSRAFRFAGLGADDVCQICYGYGLFTGGLGAHYGSLRSGATVIPISAGNTERQIRVLREMGTTVLECTPSYAMHIADTALAMGIDPSKEFSLKVGIHGAEAFRRPVAPALPLSALSRTASTLRRTTSIARSSTPRPARCCRTASGASSW